MVTVGRFQVSPTKEIPAVSSHADENPSTSPALTPVVSPDISICSSHDDQTKDQTVLERNEILSLNPTFSQHLHVDVPQAEHFSLNATHDQSQSLGLEQNLLSEAPCDVFCLHEQSQQDIKTTWTDENKEEEKEEEVEQHSGDEEPDEDQEEQQQRKKKTRRLGSVQSLTGTSVDSGLCVIMDPDRNMGIMDSPQCLVPHHNMWMSYTRTNSYISSDESESEDEEMWDELQELRQK